MGDDLIPSMAGIGNPLFGDLAFMTAAMQICDFMTMLMNADNLLFDDREFLKTIIFADRDPNFSIEIIQYAPELFKYTSDSFFGNEENVDKCLRESQGAETDGYFYDTLREKNKDFFIKTFKTNPKILEFAKRLYFDDKDFMNQLLR